jgi:hypothetical protein
LNVSSIVDVSQVVDTFLGHWYPGGSGGINFMWTKAEGLDVQWVRWDYSDCSEEMLITGDCVPFSDEDGILFTVGYAIILMIFVPMALMDLKVCTVMPAFLCASQELDTYCTFAIPILLGKCGLAIPWFYCFAGHIRALCLLVCSKRNSC